MPLVLGVILFALIIAGLIVYTIFLVREIRRNEQHDSFINAVTHELKTPIARSGCICETLQTREWRGAAQEFYRIMLQDTDRLHATVEQVLRAGRAGAQAAGAASGHRCDFDGWCRSAWTATRTSHHLPPRRCAMQSATEDASATAVVGDAEDLRTAVSNLLDNAVKYSGATR